MTVSSVCGLENGLNKSKSPLSAIIHRHRPLPLGKRQMACTIAAFILLFWGWTLYGSSFGKKKDNKNKKKE